MKSKPLFFLFCFVSIIANSQTTTRNPQPATRNYFQQQVNYKIDVTLNDVENTLDGFVKIEYTNNSPDTLHFIWFHLWPNAFKNDRTAFTDQTLENGRTDFYFSDNDKRGYINRLDFKVNGTVAKTEDHPQYIDVIKLILPTPLAPSQSINIATPFHEQIPYNFSRGGHVGQAYQITQWYPKPAVYDRKGWHPIPYLDQGEFYSEFGNFDVQVTVPKNYRVAATGELQNEEEKKWLLTKSDDSSWMTKGAKKTTDAFPPSENETKTLRYVQNNIHDFAWFADKRYVVKTDTLKLASGRIINAYSFYYAGDRSAWKNSVQYIKDAIRTRSEWLGEYPYNVVTVVEAQMGFSGGMEYPTITSISPMGSDKDLDLTIEHEVGHNWNYGILASNERDHPWMDEGMNTYFDNRYMEMKYPKQSMLDIKTKSDFINKRLPEEPFDLVYSSLVSIKKDQPIETVSEKFSELNYNLIAYYKTGLWMKVLEDYVGKEVFDNCLHEYFNQWKFKHPYPEDFKTVVEQVSKRNVDSVFSLLNKPGLLKPEKKKKFKDVLFFSFKETDKYNYTFISPSIGFNYYDKVMVGVLFHNYTLPSKPFQFFVAPMYATGSSRLTGLVRLSYSLYSYKAIQKAELSLSSSLFSSDTFIDSAGNKTYLGFGKIVPSLKIVFREKNARSTSLKFIQWKTYFLEEDGLAFARDTVRQIDIISFPKIHSYINQLRFVIENFRVLYPYKGELMAEQGKDFVRTTFTGNYFFNYTKGGGVNVRLFAGKFFYLGDKTIYKQFATDRYQLNMTGPKGYEDYTYSNYFIGRNEFDKFSSQQIMIRDGGFKVRTDLLASKIAKTDDWLAAINLSTGVPKKLNPLEILPFKIPVKVFFDAGTYADAWKKNAATGKFIYDAGFQVSLIKDLVSIYIPVAYSKVYRDYFKSTITEKRFWKNISFSIDIQNFNLRRFSNQIPL